MHSRKQGISYEVRNPADFLVEAIRNTWMPNVGHEKKVELSTFNEWFPIAKSLGLVLASIQQDGVLYVITAQQQWIPFDAMMSDYPLMKLWEMGQTSLR